MVLTKSARLLFIFILFGLFANQCFAQAFSTVAVAARVGCDLLANPQQQEAILRAKCICGYPDICLRSYAVLRKDAQIKETLNELKAAMEKVPAEEKTADDSCKDALKYKDKKSRYHDACVGIRSKLNTLVGAKALNVGGCLLQENYSRDASGTKDSYRKFQSAAALDEKLETCDLLREGDREPGDRAMILRTSLIR